MRKVYKTHAKNQLNETIDESRVTMKSLAGIVLAKQKPRMWDVLE